METAHHFEPGARANRAMLVLTCLVLPLQVFGGEAPAATNPPSRESAARNALAQGRRPAAIQPRDLEARARFLEVERFARLPEDQQTKGFAEFYRTLAPYYMNSIIEMILSSYPADILDQRGGGEPPGGDHHARWNDQLSRAAATLTPEQVADKLRIRLWLDVAGRTRTRLILQRHPDLVSALIKEDLAATDLPSTQRACTMITDLRLRQFTTNVLALYLANTLKSEPARIALVWLADPIIVRPLLEQIQKDPKSIARHAGLFQGPLHGQPAEPALLKLLDSTDPDIRYHAAYALFECKDPALAGPIAKLAQDKDRHLQSAALTLALRLPNQAFAKIRLTLVPFLESNDQETRLQAITCFAQRKDLIAGPPILRFLQQARIDPGQAVAVMQALGALTGSTFNYNLHAWGPTANARAIANFEVWLSAYPTMQ